MICLVKQQFTFVCRRSPLQQPQLQTPLSTTFSHYSIFISRFQLFNCQVFQSRSIQSIRPLTMSVQTNRQEQHQLKKAKENCSGVGIKIVCPPAAVRGMTTLDIEAFKKTISVPFVIITTKQIGNVRKRLSSVFLKMLHFKPVVAIQADSEHSDRHKIYLHPDKLPEATKLVKEVQPSLIALTESTENTEEQHQQEQFIGFEDLTLKYENFSHHDVFRAILPETVEPISGFSTIGHLLHLNLRNEALPYKQIIGQVLLDKVHSCQMVINKLDSIDSTYRNFALEVLAVKEGETPSTVVTTTESDLRFTFDFAKVYWNPRLSAERSRITGKLLAGVDVLYDVFAGVGPFALSAARLKKVRVLANDLNPASYESLVGNVKANKLTDRVCCSNLDGRTFIRTLVRTDLLEVAKSFIGADANRRYHVLMNLPDSAVDFLDAFDGLLAPAEEEEDQSYSKYCISFLNIHCYCFVKGIAEPGKAREYVIRLASEKLGHSIPEEDIEEVYDVRKVAPAKHMYRISFRLAQEILYNSNAKSSKGGDGRSLAAEQATSSEGDVKEEDDKVDSVKRPKLE